MYSKALNTYTKPLDRDSALVGAGVRRIVLAPGSRSAPFVPVLADAEAAGLISVRVVLDERSAGFIALGMARNQIGCHQRYFQATHEGEKGFTAVVELVIAQNEDIVADLVQYHRRHDFLVQTTDRKSVV